MTRPFRPAGTSWSEGREGGCLSIVVHDFAGHAFTAQLARELARCGHRVDYVSCAAFASPKGETGDRTDDPPGFRAHPLGRGSHIDKDNLARRFLQERSYGMAAARFLRSLEADVVLSANAPVIVQTALARAARRSGAAFVAWVQDLHADALMALVGRRHPLIAGLLAALARLAERRWLAGADGVILIDEIFRDRLAGRPWHLALPQATITPNWSAMPVAAAPPDPRRPSRPRRRPRLVYAGTLARKHDPALLLDLAADVDADLVVHAEGSNADWLAAEAARLDLCSLRVLPWAPVEALPALLAEADVLIALLDPVAAGWSIPSKILTYMAAGRPILAAMPAANPAARLLRETGAGLVVEPADRIGFLDGARRLIGDADLRETLGRNGRQHARKAFAIGPIAGAFERDLRRAIDRRVALEGRPLAARGRGRLLPS